MKNEFIKAAKGYFKNVTASHFIERKDETEAYFNNAQVKFHNQGELPVATIEYNGEKVTMQFANGEFYGPFRQDEIEAIKTDYVTSGENWEDYANEDEIEVTISEISNAAVAVTTDEELAVCKERLESIKKIAANLPKFRTPLFDLTWQIKSKENILKISKDIEAATTKEELKACEEQYEAKKQLAVNSPEKFAVDFFKLLGQIQSKKYYLNNN